MEMSSKICGNYEKEKEIDLVNSKDLGLFILQERHWWYLRSLSMSESSQVVSQVEFPRRQIKHLNDYIIVEGLYDSREDCQKEILNIG